jgi:hypothetical protein
MAKQARHATERMTALLAMAPKPGAGINPSELEAMQRLLHHQAAAQLSQQRELRSRIDDGVHALASTTVAVGGGRPSTRAVLQKLWTRQQRALEAGQADWVRPASKRATPLLSLVRCERWCIYASGDRRRRPRRRSRRTLPRCVRWSLSVCRTSPSPPAPLRHRLRPHPCPLLRRRPQSPPQAPLSRPLLPTPQALA